MDPGYCSEAQSQEIGAVYLLLSGHQTFRLPPASELKPVKLYPVDHMLDKSICRNSKSNINTLKTVIHQYDNMNVLFCLSCSTFRNDV